MLKSAALSVLLTMSFIAQSEEAVSSSQTLQGPDHAIISRDVIVAQGDTLPSIAGRELGKSGLASLLAEYNNMAITAQLNVGDIVRIPIHVPPRGEFAEVIFVKGKVTAARQLNTGLRAGGEPPPVISSVSDTSGVGPSDQKLELFTLSRGSQVYSGDLIATSLDGFASIAFSSGSVINLQPDTVASLTRLACLPSDDSCLIQIHTERGRVMSDVDTRDQQPMEFLISTPYASAAVRGTVFDISAEEAVLLVGVTEGAVDVNGQNSTVTLDTGFGLVVEEGQPLGEPIELIPAPVFRRVPARIAPGDTLQWWPFADAASYVAVLSTDEAANAALNSVELPSGTAALDVQQAIADSSLSSGDYFITLRAVDRNGLLGFTSNTRVTLADIDTSVTPVTTSVIREGSEFLVSVENPLEQARGYEIQISSDEDFSDPLSVDVNERGTAVFRIDQDQVFTRARVLLDPFTVSAFGESSSN